MGESVLKGYADVFGKHAAAISDHTGPASYPTGGETISVPSPLGLRSLDIVLTEKLSASGNYVVFGISPGTSGASKSSGKLKWYYAAVAQGVNGVVITTPGTGGTNGTAIINATNGTTGGTGAQVQTVTAGGIITSVKLINPGSGYSSAPVFTPAAGTGALTASVGASSDIEVAAGTNLSGETVRILAIGG